MIDKEARTVAAELVRGFSSGQLNHDELDSRWPLRTRDRGVEQIHLVLDELFRGDYREVRVSQSTPGELIALLQRVNAFLGSEREYDWPFNLTTTDGIRRLGEILSFGLLRLTSRPDWNALKASGELSSWPYRTREEAAEG